MFPFYIKEFFPMLCGNQGKRKHDSANAKPEANIKRVIGFAEYKFSKKTLVFLEVDHNKWGGDPTQFQGAATNKASTTGLTLGIDYKI